MRVGADRPLGTPEPSGSRPRQDSEAPVDGVEEGEAMDATNDDDAAMMAMMGMSGFGSTKASLLFIITFLDQWRNASAGQAS